MPLVLLETIIESNIVVTKHVSINAPSELMLLEIDELKLTQGVLKTLEFLINFLKPPISSQRFALVFQPGL